MQLFLVAVHGVDSVAVVEVHVTVAVVAADTQVAALVVAVAEVM
jgi:hypothetical protein